MNKQTVILILLFCLTNVVAQEKTEIKLVLSSHTSFQLQDSIQANTKNPSTIQHYQLNDIELSSTYLVMPFVSNENSVPSVSLSYYHRIKKWLWIGAVLNFNNVTSSSEVLDLEGNEQVNNYNCFGIAPTVRFSYVNKPNFLLYSALAVGVETIYQERKWSMATVPYFQGTLIGISYGKNLYFGGELGAGFKGILNVNVGYRF